MKGQTVKRILKTAPSDVMRLGDAPAPRACLAFMSHARFTQL